MTARVITTSPQIIDDGTAVTVAVDVPSTAAGPVLVRTTSTGQPVVVWPGCRTVLSPRNGGPVYAETRGASVTAEVTQTLAAVDLPTRAASGSGRFLVPRGSTLVTTFSTGHGWSLSGTGSSQAQRATGGPLAPDHTVITLNSTGTFTSLKKTGLTAVDMTNRHCRVFMKIKDPSAVSSISLMYAEAGGLFSQNLWAWSGQAHNVTYQIPPAVFLEPDEWAVWACTYPERGLTNVGGTTVTDPGGANGPDAVTELQVAFTPVNGMSTEVAVGGFYICPNGI